MSDNIFEKLTAEEQDHLWMYMIFNRDKIIEKTEEWTKEAEKAGMTLTEYLESINPLNDKKKKARNVEIKTVTNAKEAEAYPINENMTKGFEGFTFVDTTESEE